MIEIDSVTYELEYDPQDRYVRPNLRVAFCDPLAADFAPILFDPKGYGSTPFPPDLLAYRLIMDNGGEKLCLLYEVYWPRQDCSWRELNKDHDHDYEQIQIQFNLKTGAKKYIISSVGPVDCAGHGVEVFEDVPAASFENLEYVTSPKKYFPWGGDLGEKNLTQIRIIPIGNLLVEGKRPGLKILNCYHAFVGIKTPLLPEERIELNPKLERLDPKILDRWYYLNKKNRYGHDISNPFEEPYIMYYPPPEDGLSIFAYTVLWTFYTVKRKVIELLSKLASKLPHH